MSKVTRNFALLWPLTIRMDIRIVDGDSIVIVADDYVLLRRIDFENHAHGNNTQISLLNTQACPKTFQL